jgi:hypothetical protein
MTVNCGFERLKNSDLKGSIEMIRGFLLRLVCICVGLVFAGCEPNVPVTAAAQNEVIATGAMSILPVSAPVNLGVIVQGESSQINQWVINHTEKPITVAKIYTSCGCMEAQLSELEIAPSQKVFATFKYDGIKEPDFAGSLEIEVTFAESSGRIVGRFGVVFEVVSRISPGVVGPHSKVGETQ